MVGIGGSVGVVVAGGGIIGERRSTRAGARARGATVSRQHRRC